MDPVNSGAIFNLDPAYLRSPLPRHAIGAGRGAAAPSVPPVAPAVNGQPVSRGPPGSAGLIRPQATRAPFAAGGGIGALSQRSKTVAEFDSLVRSSPLPKVVADKLASPAPQFASQAVGPFGIATIPSVDVAAQAAPEAEVFKRPLPTATRKAVPAVSAALSGLGVTPALVGGSAPSGTEHAPPLTASKGATASTGTASSEGEQAKGGATAGGASGVGQQGGAAQYALSFSPPTSAVAATSDISSLALFTHGDVSDADLNTLNLEDLNAYYGSTTRTGRDDDDDAMDIGAGMMAPDVAAEAVARHLSSGRSSEPPAAMAPTTVASHAPATTTAQVPPAARDGASARTEGLGSAGALSSSASADAPVSAKKVVAPKGKAQESKAEGTAKAATTPAVTPTATPRRSRRGQATEPEAPAAVQGGEASDGSDAKSEEYKAVLCRWHVESTPQGPCVVGDVYDEATQAPTGTPFRSTPVRDRPSALVVTCADGSAVRLRGRPDMAAMAAAGVTQAAAFSRGFPSKWQSFLPGADAADGAKGQEKHAESAASPQKDVRTPNKGESVGQGATSPKAASATTRRARLSKDAATPAKDSAPTAQGATTRSPSKSAAAAEAAGAEKGQDATVAKKAAPRAARAEAVTEKSPLRKAADSEPPKEVPSTTRGTPQKRAAAPVFTPSKALVPVMPTRPDVLSAVPSFGVSTRGSPRRSAVSVPSATAASATTATTDSGRDAPKSAVTAPRPLASAARVPSLLSEAGTADGARRTPRKGAPASDGAAPTSAAATKAKESAGARSQSAPAKGGERKRARDASESESEPESKRRAKSPAPASASPAKGKGRPPKVRAPAAPASRGGTATTPGSADGRDGLRTTRSGRVAKPPMAFWAGERIIVTAKGDVTVVKASPLAADMFGELKKKTKRMRAVKTEPNGGKSESGGDSSEDAFQSTPWTDEERKALNSAIERVSPTDRNYWDTVAALVGTRTAAECRAMFHDRHPTPAQVKRKGRAPGKKDGGDAGGRDADGGLVIEGGAGTLKRRRNLRDIMAKMAEAKGDDDVFESTPLKKRPIRTDGAGPAPKRRRVESDSSATSESSSSDSEGAAPRGRGRGAGRGRGRGRGRGGAAPAGRGRGRAARKSEDEEDDGSDSDSSGTGNRSPSLGRELLRPIDRDVADAYVSRMRTSRRTLGPRGGGVGAAVRAVKGPTLGAARTTLAAKTGGAGGSATHGRPAAGAGRGSSSATIAPDMFRVGGADKDKDSEEEEDFYFSD